MDDLLKNSQSSITAACKSIAKTKGSYRFLKNDKVPLSGILAPHVQSTIERIEPGQYLLNLQDTSALNFHNHNSKKDRGHIGTSPQKNDSLGYWLHTGLLCSTEGIPQGISYQECWSRTKVHREDKDRKKSRLRSEPIENKESYKWLAGVDECTPYVNAGAQIVQVCDREADIFEFLQHCLKMDQSFVVRAKSDRKILLPSGQSSLLFSSLKRSQSQAIMHIEIEGNSSRKASSVEATVKFRRVKLQVPTSNRTAAEAKKLKPLDLTLIEVHSSSKIAGKKLHWRILTDLNIEKISDVLEVIKWYTLRWRIEIFFKTLKSGAKIEESRLTDLDRLSKLILMKSLVAYRVLHLLFSSRNKKYSSIRSLISTQEWNVYKKILFPGKGRASEKTSEWIVRIAQYGGFIPGRGRTPGIITFWMGWSELNAIFRGAKVLGVTG